VTAFLRFAALRMDMAETLTDAEVPGWDRLLTKFDRALNMLWGLLSEEDKVDAMRVVYQTGIQNRDGTAKPWAVDLVERIEGLADCARRQEVITVRNWIDGTLMKAIDAQTLARVGTELGTQRRTIERYFDQGYLGSTGAKNLLERINNDVRCAAFIPLSELPMISRRFRKKPDDARKTAEKKRP
jgi:hypothetical protein